MTALPNGVLPSVRLVPAGAGKSELTVRLIDVPEALAALPVWARGRGGRPPGTPWKERPQTRRNVEAAMAMLDDLDVVADEWPYGLR